MNFEYRFEDWDGSKLIAYIEPNPLIVGDYELLESALDSDIVSYDKTLEYIDDVMSGKKEQDYIGGDITSIDCRKDKTVISWEEIFHNTESTCELPTWLFREIVETWLKAVHEYRRKLGKE